MPQTPADIRAHRGSSDLPLLIDFARRCCAERFPLGVTWHPGDFVWQLQPDYERAHPEMRLWLVDGAVEQVSWFTAPHKLWLETLPGSEHRVAEAIGKAEILRRRTAGDDAPPTLAIRAFENDTRRVATLESLGYRKGDPDGVWFRRDLTEPLPEFALPEGMRLRDSIGVDPALRAAAHRDAWNDLAEIGIKDAKSSFMTESYRAVAGAPVYDPSLDILVENADGLFVAGTICWADPATGMVIFEPVGTHGQFRRRGLARLAMLEALRRLQARGLKHAGVGTAHFNAPAIATYSSFFTPLARTFWWEKTLA